MVLGVCVLCYFLRFFVKFLGFLGQFNSDDEIRSAIDYRKNKLAVCLIFFYTLYSSSADNGKLWKTEKACIYYLY